MADWALNAIAVAVSSPPPVPIPSQCRFEGGVAMLVVAHLAQAGARDSPLPERLQQATRPKLSEIDGEETRACEAADSPRRVLRQTSRAIAEARFTGKGDREAVQLMLAELEWLMKTAFDQLLEVLAESEAEPDPSQLAASRPTARDDGAARLLPVN